MYRVDFVFCDDTYTELPFGTSVVDMSCTRSQLEPMSFSTSSQAIQYARDCTSKYPEYVVARVWSDVLLYRSGSRYTCPDILHSFGG